MRLLAASGIDIKFSRFPHSSLNDSTYFIIITVMMSSNAITNMLNFTQMVMSFKPKMGDSLGRYLKQVREETQGTPKQFSSTEAAKRSGISQSYISKLEDEGLEETIRKKWNPTKQLALLRGYGLSNKEVIDASHHFGLQAHLLLNEAPIPTPISRGELVAIRDLGTIQGGLKGLSFSSDDYEYVNVHQDDINGFSPENCFRVTVTGDSMVSEDVAQKISPGSKAIFHILNSKMQPKENDVVAVWLKDEDMGVIKSFHKTPDYVILNSFNKRHRPIILDERNQGIIQGVLISVTHMFRQ